MTRDRPDHRRHRRAHVLPDLRAGREHPVSARRSKLGAALGRSTRRRCRPCSRMPPSPAPWRRRGRGRVAASILAQRSGLAGRSTHARALAARLRLSRTSTRAELARMEPAFDLLPRPRRRAATACWSHEGKQLLAVIADPFDADAARLARAARAAGRSQWALAAREDLASYIGAARTSAARHRRARCRTRSAGSSASRGSTTCRYASISEDTSPVVRLVHSTLYDALRAGASDIHLETRATGLVVRYRIDGVLVQHRPGAGRGAGRAGHLAHQGDVGARHRRAPRAAGRPLQDRVREPRRSISASRSCPASSARTRCCACSTSRRSRR